MVLDFSGKPRRRSASADGAFKKSHVEELLLIYFYFFGNSCKNENRLTEEKSAAPQRITTLYIPHGFHK